MRVFIAYFKKEWVDQNSNWFEGYNHPNNVGAPSTNNGNEPLNATIKTSETLRARLAMNPFLSCIMTLITKWSYQRNPSNPNFKPFITEPVIELKQWILAYQWKSKVVAEAKSNKTVW